jgi:hypothetical protein
MLNKGMRCSLHLLLLLLAADQFVQADRVPKIVVTPSYSVVVTDLTVVQYGPLVSISGHLRRSDPWAGTAWGYLEISLFEQNGGLIRQLAADYSPRPIPHSFHSAYQPQSRFSVNINAVTRPVRVVKIAYRDSPLPHLKSDSVDRRYCN